MLHKITVSTGKAQPRSAVAWLILLNPVYSLPLGSSGGREEYRNTKSARCLPHSGCKCKDFSTLCPVQGTSAGAKDQEADNFLEKRFKNHPAFTYEETVQTAIATLQNVLSEDLKATEIEVGIIACLLVLHCVLFN